MKKKKKLKEPKYETDEQQEIRRFIIILIVVVALVIGIYLFTKYVIKKPKVDLTETVTTGAIDYSVVTVGTMLNKKDESYYVLAYDSKSNDASKYSTMQYTYSVKTGTLPIYICDLSNALNKDYVATDKSNPKATKIDELALGEVTLIKVANGKIVKYIEGEANINKELGL